MGPRLDGWEGRLYTLIDDARARPFEFGERDCFSFVCEVVKALTGEDRWPEFAGYGTPFEAAALIVAHGGTHESAGTWFFGAPPIAIRLARRGDAVLLDQPNGDRALGICIGAMSSFRAPAGLMFIPTFDCSFAWRIG